MEGGGLTTLGESVWGVRLSTTTDALFSGQTLDSGKTMYSSSGGYRTSMQPDGNLVTYNSNNQWVWRSQTCGSTGARLVMQPDGNLVIRNTSGEAIWHTHTDGSGGAYVVIQGDHNFVVYQGNQPLWASG